MKEKQCNVVVTEFKLKGKFKRKGLIYEFRFKLF